MYFIQCLNTGRRRGKNMLLPCLFRETIVVRPGDKGFAVPSPVARFRLVQIAVRQVDQMPVQHSPQHKESFVKPFRQHYLHGHVHERAGVRYAGLNARCSEACVYQEAVRLSSWCRWKKQRNRTFTKSSNTISASHDTSP